MVMNPITNSHQEKQLLYNGLLFCALRSYDNTDTKIENLKKYLANSADINTSDANNNYNTPLHVAVMKDEPEVVKFLLQKGANPYGKNLNKHTSIDLAIICQNKNKNEIIKIIDTSINSISNSLPQMKLPNTESEDKTIRTNKVVKVNMEKALVNESRSGTAGFCGQLYESKLLGLLLFRALHDHDIQDFFLGSNITGIGALDDIVFKYYLKNQENPKIFFVQAKHRDNPTKDVLTVDNILKLDDDFSLYKYFESYMKIIKKMNQKSENVMFKNNFDCNFIIYTPAVERFHQKKIFRVLGKESLLSTSGKGEIFTYDYGDEDIKALMKNSLIFQAKSLAKVFAKNIARHKIENMMWDELIKIYHVFLAQNVVYIFKNKSDCLMGTFRKSFLESENEILVQMKETMFKELKLNDNISMDSSNIILDFKLPKHFGNFKLPIDDKEYIDIWKVIKNVMEHGKKPGNENTIIIDETIIGNSIKKQDMTLVGYLVGSTLILDDQTGMLKFNLAESSSEKTKMLIKSLQSNIEVGIDIKKCRFEINIPNFPKLSLGTGQDQKYHIIDFLNKLQFHTNQAKENEVESILKKEINDLYYAEVNNNDALFHVIKGDAIYLHFHDKIQKWWKNPDKYLSKSCPFYKNAKDFILNSPLVNIYSHFYIRKINNLEIHFDQRAIDFLGLQTFMDNSVAKVFFIITKDKILSSIKVKQYFDHNRIKFYQTNYKFIDFDAMARVGNNELFLSELNGIMTDLVILILSEDVSNPLAEFQIQVLLMLKQINIKFIVISHSHSFLEVIETNFKYVEQKDQNISFCDLDNKTKLRLVDRKSILFQGIEVPFVSIVTRNMHHLVKGKVLVKIIKNEILKIGKEPTNIKAYDERKKHYVNRRICRCIKLVEKQYHNDFNIIDDDTKNNSVQNNEDILIFSKYSHVFRNTCKKHLTKNIHWFRKKGDDIMWEKTYGSLKKIIPWVEKKYCNENDICSLEPQSLKHINDRVVVLSGGPGMGKSTLLTHLMMQTKYSQKSLCVVKINLLDYKNIFNTWQECDVSLRLGLLLPVLYSAFSSCYSLNKQLTTNNENDHEIMESLLDTLDTITFVDSDSRMHIIAQEVRALNKNIDFTILEFQVFLHLYNNGKMALMFDGFDEICPHYKIEAIKVLKLLVSSRVRHLWITSRSYLILNELESELNTFAFKLKDFTMDEQSGLLKKIWENNISQCTLSSFQQTRLRTNFTLYVEQFFGAIKYNFKDNQKDFTGTPLHLHMIADTYQEYFMNYYIYDKPNSKEELKDAFNLITLYDKFINIKFTKIRFNEKKDGLCLNDPDLKTVIDGARRVFIENHKVLAAYSLLYSNKNNYANKPEPLERVSNTQRTERLCPRNHIGGIFSENDLKLVHSSINQINLGQEKTGIVEGIIENVPKFVHLTYAEYFASEFLCDKLLQSNDSKSTWKYIINHVLVLDNGGIRGFINAKLEKNQILSNFTSNDISDALLRQRHFSKSALNLAVIERHDNLALFLMNNLKKHLNRNRLNDFIALILKKIARCTLCSIYERHYQPLMKIIIEIITRLDCYKLPKLFFCQDYPKCNIFLLTFIHIDMFPCLRDKLDTLVQFTDPEDLTKLLVTPMDDMFPRFSYKFPILHILLRQGRKIIDLLKYIKVLNNEQRMNVFCARDEMRRVPAHWAAFYDNFEFFDIMETLVTKNQFKKICTLSDAMDQIPLRCFGSIPLTLDKYKPLCAKAGIAIGFRSDRSGWFLYDTENPDCNW